MSERTAPDGDCWNRIGVQGDHSCERLDEHGHCRHCEVFGAAARDVMRRALPPGYRSEWSAHFARPPEAARTADRSALVFRIGPEWLALPAHMALGAADPAAPRRLPHRADPVLLGLVNIRGHLYPCVSLARLLQIDEREPAAHPGPRAYARMLAVQFEQLAAAVPVAELFGLHRYAAQELEAPSAASAQAVPRYVNGVLSVGDKRIGCLDAGLLGQQLARRIK